MKVLVTGARGMLGNDVCQALQENLIEYVGVDLADFDLADASMAEKYIGTVNPTHIINCAAYTAVDLAESNYDDAYKGNVLTCESLAKASMVYGIKLLSISTDFVFDGKKEGPYVESDPPGPLGAYGKTKLLGEQAIQATCAEYWIVRTAWLYGLHGKCFPDTIIKAASVRPELKVVADQFGCPTFSEDLAALVVKLIGTEHYGIFHATNSGKTSWYEFAAEAVRLSGISTPVLPITTAEYPTPAIRPANSVLISENFPKIPLEPLRNWKIALQDYIGKRTARNAC